MMQVLNDFLVAVFWLGVWILVDLAIVLVYAEYRQVSR